MGVCSVEVVTKAFLAGASMNAGQLALHVSSLDDLWDDHQPLILSALSLLLANPQKQPGQHIDLSYAKSVAVSTVNAWKNQVVLYEEPVVAVVLSVKYPQIADDFPLDVYCYYACVTAGYLTRNWDGSAVARLVCQARDRLADTANPPAVSSTSNVLA